MGDLEALDQHTCAACGAHAEWNPTRRALVCSYCGTVAPAALDPRTGEVHENELAQALRELPEESRESMAERKAVRCQRCQAVSVFPAARIGERCEFCGSPELVDYEQLKAPIRPRSVLPFALDRSRAQGALRSFWAGRWLAPGTLKRAASLETVQGIYVPYWTFDAAVHASFTAESGTYYSTSESYRDAQGNVRTRTVQHVRWSPFSGTIDHVFDDRLVPGTRGIATDLLSAVEPFPTRDLVPYATAYLAGFVVEHYQVVLVEAAQAARLAMEDELRRMCAAKVPGDTQRNLRVEPSWSGETFKHVLLPVWLLAYRFGGRSYQVVVNGVTGTIAGRSPKSPWKVLGLVLLVLLAGIVAILLQR